MARRSSSTFKKRQKEMARQDRRQDKEARRMQRKKEREEREPGTPPSEDPDIAGISPGPQPPREDEQQS
jgi:hypothetical protein